MAVIALACGDSGSSDKSDTSAGTKDDSPPAGATPSESNDDGTNSGDESNGTNNKQPATEEASSSDSDSDGAEIPADAIACSGGDDCPYNYCLCNNGCVVNQATCWTDVGYCADAESACAGSTLCDDNEGLYSALGSETPVGILGGSYVGTSCSVWGDCPWWNCFCNDGTVTNEALCADYACGTAEDACGYGSCDEHGGWSGNALSI